MSWKPLVSGTANTLVSNTQLTATCGTVSIGDTINVSATPGQDVGGIPPTGVVTDDLGNVYANTARVSDGTNHQLIETWKAIVTVAGTPTVKIQYNPTPGTTPAGNCSLNVDPVSGSDAASVVDGGSAQLQAAPGTNTDDVSSGSFITSTPGDLIYTACVDTQTGADPGPNGTGFVTASVSGGVVLRSAYRVQQFPGLVAGRFTAATGADRFITAAHAITPAAPAPAPVGAPISPMPPPLW